MTHDISFSAALRFWFKLGFISFGGPAGQIALMHAELVEKRRWISERRFLHALNYCMLLPGPEAQQLATYLGWLMHRHRGGLAAGVCFVLPSLLILIALSWLYMAFGQQPLVAGLFYGIKPAVCAIVLQAAWRIGGRTLHHPYLWAIAALAFCAIFFLHLPFPLIVAGAAVLGWLGGRFRPEAFRTGRAAPALAAPHAPALIDDDSPPPAHARFSRRRLALILGLGALLWAVPMAWLAASAGPSHLLTQTGWFFTKAALLTFGGAYAVLPYVYQGAVGHYGWLSPTQMIDGLALGETTPGPLIMVVAFVGFVGGWQHAAQLASGAWLSGPAIVFTAIATACVATYFTFLPSFLFIFAGAPLVEATRDALAFTAPLTAITAAVVGVIVNLALFFAAHVFWPQGFAAALDWAAIALALGAAVALLRYRCKVLGVLAACALAGLLTRGLA
ncbi:MAG: chromate efflux transporter [Uliginosibacterium sp.]|nr:chromate efflux transporter [Uliginosibacterium sp.]